MIASFLSVFSLSVRSVASGSLLALTLLGLTQEAGAGQAPPPEPHSAIAKVRHWIQVGVASWYGPRFQGRPTANGETFNMHQLTCAHRTLPLGTWLRVTNLVNRKTVLVRVNDRGPMVDGRIVDLSYAAAKAVGIDGLGEVRLEKVNPSDPSIKNETVARLTTTAFAR
jgi:rare lipoprotein A